MDEKPPPPHPDNSGRGCVFPAIMITLGATIPFLNTFWANIIPDRLSPTQSEVVKGTDVVRLAAIITHLSYNTLSPNPDIPWYVSTVPQAVIGAATSISLLRRY